jgi:hypothetical protein
MKLFIPRMHASVAVFFLIFAAACVSKPQETSTEEGLQSGRSDNAAQPVKVFEKRASSKDRLIALGRSPQQSAPSSFSSAASAVAAAENAGSSAPKVNDDADTGFSRFVDATALLVRSGQWSELLKETHAGWQKCLGQGAQLSDNCGFIGQTRATAFSKTGHIREAMNIYDALASRRASSLDALVFAGILSDAGSSRLCWSLAGNGLQWEPADARLELFSLQAKCLRQDALPDKAREVITRGLAEYPEHPKLLLESALLFLSEKKLTQGCELLERLYLQEFRDVAVFFNWGQCLVGRRDTTAARSILEKARREFPSERLWILLSGEVAFLEGNLNGARREGLDYLANSEAADAFRVKAEVLIRNAQGE